MDMVKVLYRCPNTDNIYRVASFSKQLIFIVTGNMKTREGTKPTNGRHSRKLTHMIYISTSLHIFIC